MAQGRTEGLLQGALQARRDDLRVLLEDRFGPLSASVLQRIESADDLNRLQTALRDVNRLQRIEDLQL
jgi:hypothetical protein